MKNKLHPRTEACRIKDGPEGSDSSYGFNGKFEIPVGKEDLCVVVSDQKGWDHVSVSLLQRCPTWEEMCQIKDLFFREDETVFQFHPKRSRYINQHPYCLHLWRPHKGKVKLPPSWMVGV